ncbi:MAG: 50S ribosomal protein L4 [Planctomycetota bacterium]|nr:50S ribosomal protein L4 [Planctomycetota bacterium]
MTTGLDNPREVQKLDPVDVPFHGADGKEQGTKSFTPGAVTNYPNITLLKEAIRRYQGRMRRGTAKTKNRSEIHGSPRKPWRQKGTGRARSGSKKSPIWKGGGVVFGPRPRSYDYGMSRKQRRIATRHALLSKLIDGEARIIEEISADKPSTASFRNIADTLGLNRSFLIGLPSEMSVEDRRSIWMSARNLEGVEVLPVCDFNALSLLKCQNLLLTGAAFEEVQQRESAFSDQEGA